MRPAGKARKGGEQMFDGGRPIPARRGGLVVGIATALALGATACGQSAVEVKSTANDSSLSDSTDGETAILTVAVDLPAVVGLPDENKPELEESDAYNFCSRTSKHEDYVGSRAFRLKVNVYDSMGEILGVGYSSPTADAATEAQFAGNPLGNFDSILMDGCTVEVLVPDLPADRDFYSVEVDRTEALPNALASKVTYSLEELEGEGWAVTLAKRE